MARRIASLVKPGGRWLLVEGCLDGPHYSPGPPLVALTSLVGELEAAGFAVLWAKRTTMDATARFTPGQPRPWCWAILAERKGASYRAMRAATTGTPASPPAST